MSKKDSAEKPATKTEIDRNKDEDIARQSSGIENIAAQWIERHGLDGGALRLAEAVTESIRAKMLAACEALKMETAALDAKRQAYIEALGGPAPLDAAEASKLGRTKRALGLKPKDESELLVELKRILADPKSSARTTRGLARATGWPGAKVADVLAANGYEILDGTWKLKA